MTKSIEFYFDFVSPYSFLAHKKICKIKNSENIKYKSIAARTNIGKMDVTKILQIFA